MNSPKALRYPRWKAPAEDGQIVIWPEPTELLRQTEQNHSALQQAESLIQHVPLREMRQRMRRWIGHDDARPLIATGHQTELYHPGVWAKNVLVNLLAGKLGGDGLHLAVDTDAPKHLHLRWPGGWAPLTDDASAGTAEWSGQLQSPTPAHVDELQRTVDAAASQWGFAPMVDVFLDALKPLSAERVGLSWAIANAMHLVDWELGLKHHALVTSPLWQSPPYLLFVHHLLARARSFAQVYNAALADYRRQQGIRNQGRPMPDMALADDTCEVPFWLDHLASGTRTRATVHRRGDWMLGEGDDAFVLDAHKDGWQAAEELSQWLQRHDLRLAPRALTLTLFVRLALVDQFVHGIGGGQYDQVTDRIIADEFAIQPPGFSVTTATLLFAGAVGRQRVCLPCIRQQLHHARHALLGDAKQQLVQQISEAPRHSERRATLFARMHQQLAEAQAHDLRLAQLQRHLAESETRFAEEQVLFDRELFYAMQPRQRLEMLIDKYDQHF